MAISWFTKPMDEVALMVGVARGLFARQQFR
jgi:hypothetical protein